MVKTKDFNHIKYYLENLETQYNNVNKLNRIVRYHEFLISICRIRNCFTKSVGLFICLKINGFMPVLHIDFQKEKVFYSHAWISEGKKRFFFERNKQMKNILKIS
tara:strand:- start:2171 stop:2485 length:315 start_codon:yes stop_codon:yes gene_type:complete